MGSLVEAGADLADEDPLAVVLRAAAQPMDAAMEEANVREIPVGLPTTTHLMKLVVKCASRRTTQLQSAGTGLMKILFLINVLLQLLQTHMAWTPTGTLIPVPRITSLVN